MAKNYAVIEDDKVINVILAESLEVAEEVTEKECIETDGSIWLDSVRINGKWIAPEVPEVIEEPVTIEEPVIVDDSETL